MNPGVEAGHIGRALLVLVLASTTGGCRTGSVHDLPPTIVRPETAQRVELWRADLAALESGLVRSHVAPFAKQPEVIFRALVDDLHERIPYLDDDEIVIELARIGASIGDGHTGFYLHGGRLGLRPGPLWLMSFEDGIFVKGVAGDLGADILNQELIRVGGVEIDEALDRLTPLIPRDNAQGLELTAPGYLNLPRVLCAMGLSAEPEAATYVFRDAAGNEVEQRCEALAPAAPAVFAVRYSADATGAPLAEQLRSQPYALERIEDSVLLQYNACRNGPGESFREFCKRVFTDLGRNPPRRLVIDLRWNSGGNSSITKALLVELRRHPELTAPECLRVLIGPGTFSSGMWAAVDLAREFDALLVGSATGGTPNAPGEVGTLVLPNSRLDCRYARRLWHKGGRRYSGPSLPPRVFVRETSAQHFAGRDMVLEAALAGP